jgi:ribose 5-phosphate isomerase B
MEPVNYIYLGGDHAGFVYKEIVKKYLLDNGYKIVDFGPHSYEKNDDFPDFLHPLAKKLSKFPNNKAIIFGGSGIGESIVLNRYNGVRCGVWFCSELDIISNGRTHDDINSLSIGSRFIDKNQLLKAIEVFLKTPFSNEIRHARRVNKIDRYLLKLWNF